MEPNKFRESRISIKRMYDQIDQLIEDKAIEESQTRFETARCNLEALEPEAEGEIQQRSVKNLSMRLNNLATRIDKLASKKTTSRSSSKGAATIIWDEERLSGLALSYVERVLGNMANDEKATVMLGTTGKGIRPNYTITYSDGRVQGFAGSGHKPLKNTTGAAGKNLSDPFDYSLIRSIWEKLQ